ncbi:hypothetical protein BDQ12DRAFT_719985 [Crucibulum laeve]|uniref:Uncharacterized protein n=1 Tax=Crucibulum laeve TaxID=68775 RepID=A0A5C3MB33_9AGAR|nr:hypothetical protein BDQ12DRAFT_719985 [Crucibulum laeve]
MAAALSGGLSASVTRILYLTGFPKELKTKDIQSAFAEYEGQSGGFKIKWRDDTSLLIVFQDASVGEHILVPKRAYLNTIAFPPPILTSSSTGTSAIIKPYDGPDAQTVIQTVNSRGQHNPSASRSHNGRAASISVFPNARTASSSSSQAYRTNNNSTNGSSTQPGAPSGQHVTIPEHPNGRDQPSPTLPSLPSHPTLNALISSSLGEAVAGTSSVPADPAILTTSLQAEAASGPRIGDPGKRMLGAALGVRHPGLGPRVVNGSSGSGSPGGSIQANGGAEQAMREIQRAMGGLTVAE